MSKRQRGRKKSRKRPARAKESHTFPHRFYAVLSALLLIVVAGSLWTIRDGELHQIRNSAATTLQSSTVSQRSVEEAIQLGATYLCLQLLDDGQFIYRVNLDNSVNVKARYNILRHAGTIYAMGMIHAVFPGEELAQAISEAGNFLRAQIGPVPGHPDVSAIWSRPEIHMRTIPVQAKLGGTGLGLVALLTEEKIRPGTTEATTLKDLGNFLVMMQQSSGGFYSKYIPSRDGFDDWVSLYYPGEAALGLMMLYDNEGGPQWLASATAAMEYLAKTREGARDVPHDHWALLATARLLPHIDKEQQWELHELLVGHTMQICGSILRAQQPLLNDSVRTGSFDEQGRTTPCATRLEGLLAALSYLPYEQAELRQRIRVACDRGIEFLLRAQIDEGLALGGFPRSIFGNSRYGRLVVSKREPRWSEIRIDYVQHALSALLQYRQVQLEDTHCGVLVP